MVHRYVWDKGHELTIVHAFLYGQMFILMYGLESNSSYDRHNHAWTMIILDRRH
jgi:hypothetical protein